MDTDLHTVQVLQVPTHFPRDWILQKLHHHFSQPWGGEVLRVQYPTRTPGQALVTFKHQEAAERIFQYKHVLEVESETFILKVKRIEKNELIKCSKDLQSQPAREMGTPGDGEWRRQPVRRSSTLPSQSSRCWLVGTETDSSETQWYLQERLKDKWQKDEQGPHRVLPGIRGSSVSAAPRLRYVNKEHPRRSYSSPTYSTTPGSVHPSPPGKVEIYEMSNNSLHSNDTDLIHSPKSYERNLPQSPGRRIFPAPIRDISEAPQYVSNERNQLNWNHRAALCQPERKQNFQTCLSTDTYTLRYTQAFQKQQIDRILSSHSMDLKVEESISKLILSPNVQDPKMARNMKNAQELLSELLKNTGCSLQTQDINLSKYSAQEQSAILSRYPGLKDVYRVVVELCGDRLRLVGAPLACSEMKQKLLGNSAMSPVEYQHVTPSTGRNQIGDCEIAVRSRSDAQHQAGTKTPPV